MPRSGSKMGRRIYAARKVVDAVMVPGKNPAYHFAQQERLKEEWPTLYWALMRLVKEMRA